MSAAQLAAKMAFEDDYRDDEDGKKHMHRLSRKKRRRIDSLKAIAEAEAEDKGKG